MKKIFLSAAVLTLSFASAQKKEIGNAFKAIESGDNNTAVAQLSAAETAMGNKTYLLEPESLEQYYYTKGLTLMNSGKTQEGAAFLAKINDLSKMKIYSGKNSEKERVYYVGKDAADKSGVSGLKEETYIPTTSSKLAQKINPVLQKTNQAAVDAFNAKNYAVAGDKFEETYFLLKAAGTDDKSILMNAAIAYSTAEKIDKATEIYNGLIESGYTGIETTYTAKNKKSGEADKLDKSSWDLYKKMGDKSEYSDFKMETSKSVEKDLYTVNAQNLYNAKRYDEAIKVVDKGLVKFPGDGFLLNIKGLSYYNSGKSEEFIEILKTQLAANPKDHENWYNLGLMYRNDPATAAESQAAYEKAIEIKPDYIPALQNVTYLIMGEDEKAIEKYNAAKKAGKMDEANKILEARRDRFIKAIPFAEKWYAAAPTSLDVVSLLKGLYRTAKDNANIAKFEALEATLKAKEGIK